MQYFRANDVAGFESYPVGSPIPWPSATSQPGGLSCGPPPRGEAGIRGVCLTGPECTREMAQKHCRNTSSKQLMHLSVF
ncbi:minor pilin subunit [Escherichia coli]|uniref:Minor pilin subunit n=1 Tax=Escherichia coli TaxID=562 RepID=A0A376VTN4_ECOLX|nr:minor pilin subunit [Escherichia coli]